MYMETWSQACQEVCFSVFYLIPTGPNLNLHSGFRDLFWPRREVSANHFTIFSRYPSYCPIPSIIYSDRKVSGVKKDPKSWMCLYFLDPVWGLKHRLENKFKVLKPVWTLGSLMTPNTVNVGILGYSSKVKQVHWQSYIVIAAYSAFMLQIRADISVFLLVLYREPLLK